MAGSSGDEEDIISGNNVTPMVDIVLVLLVIFMVTAPILMKNAIPLQLPRAKTAEESKVPILSVAISKDQNIYINGKEAAMDQIANAVSDLKAKLKVGQAPSAFVSADTRASYGIFAKVVDKLRETGVYQIALDTKPQEFGEENPEQ